MSRYLVVLLVMVLSAVALAMFSFESDLPPLPHDPQNRGTFVYADTQDPGNLDPGKTSASIDFRVLKCLYQTLMVYAYGGESLEPGVAESHTISEDGRVYTFRLREDAKWSNGDTVVAGDFIYAWRRAMLAETGSDYRTLFDLIDGVREFNHWRSVLLDYSALETVLPDSQERDAFTQRYPELQKQSELSGKEKWQLTLDQFARNVGMKALDDRTLQVSLTTRTPHFIELCAFPTFSPLPEQVIEKNLEPMTDNGVIRVNRQYWSDPDRLVTNGPYALTRWDNKQRLVMDQNANYWDKDRMGNLRIILRVVPDETLALALFQDGQVDWIAQVGSSQLKAKLFEAGYPYAHADPRAGVYYYQFNCRPTLPNGRPNPLADARVRRALGMCIDRQKIVKSVTRNNEPLAYTFVPVGSIPGYDAPVEAGLRYDPQAARALLAEAGYPEGKGLPPIDLLVSLSGTSGGHKDIALVIKKSWEEQLGLPDITIEEVEFQVYIEQSKQGNFTVRRAGWYGDYRDPTTWLDMLRKEDSNNDSGYDNPAYDKLLADAAVEADAAVRMQKLRDAEALLLHEAPIVPLYYYVETSVYDPTEADIRPNPWNNLRLDLVRKTRD